MSAQVLTELHIITGKTGEGIPVKGKKKARSDIRLDVDEDNLPLLPEETPTSRVDVDAVVRQFITGHYRMIQFLTSVFPH